jgi:tetratricopeptide (TPR) repeat protein
MSSNHGSSPVDGNRCAVNPVSARTPGEFHCGPIRAIIAAPVYLNIESDLVGKSMRRTLAALTASTAILAAAWSVAGDPASAATSEPTDQQIDSAPCVAAIAANDDERIIAACGALIDNDKTLRADRLKALIARAGAYDRTGQLDRAIADDDVALRLDPTLADVFNARGELWYRKGDRPRALADFGAAIRLNPQHAAARANYKSLAQELERLGAQMAIKNKPTAPLK